MFQRHVGKLFGENVNNNRTTAPLFAKLDKKYLCKSEFEFYSYTEEK